MSLSKHVTVEVGGYTWEWFTGQPLTGWPAAAYLTEQLRVTEATSSSDGLWPPEVSPAEATFELVAADASQLDQLRLGDAVRIRLWVWTPPADYDPAATPLVAFHGRVAAATMRPHDLGVVLTVECVDYTADLGQYETGDTAVPSTALYAQLQQLWAAAGDGAAGTVDTGAYGAWYPGNGQLTSVADGTPGSGQLALPARPAEVKSLAELVKAFLVQWPVIYTNTILASRGYARLHPTTENGFSWTLVPLFAHPVYVAPGKLVLVAGLYRLRVAPGLVATASVVPAAAVDVGTTFTLWKESATTRVVVTGVFGGVEGKVVKALPIAPPVTATVEVTLPTKADAGAVATMYLQDVTEADRWAATGVAWFVDESGYTGQAIALGDVLVVSGLQANQEPNRADYLTGVITGRELALSDGELTATFELGQPSYAADPTTVATWYDPGTLAGRTWAQLDPTDTWQNYRLLSRES